MELLFVKAQFAPSFAKSAIRPASGGSDLTDDTGGHFNGTSEFSLVVLTSCALSVAFFFKTAVDFVRTFLPVSAFLTGSSCSCSCFLFTCLCCSVALMGVMRAEFASPSWLRREEFFSLGCRWTGEAPSAMAAEDFDDIDVAAATDGESIGLQSCSRRARNESIVRRVLVCECGEQKEQSCTNLREGRYMNNCGGAKRRSS